MWQYDSYHHSIISAGNGGTKPTQPAFTIFYNQGTQRYDLEQTLQPDGQMWIDVGQLIREHVPDKNGKLLPPDLTYGSYEFRDLTNTGIGSLFEGKVIYDKTYGHVAYGCAECCGFSTTVPWYNPVGVPIYTAVADGVNALNSCANIFEDESSSFYNNWSSANTAIATVDKYGNHTGVAQGSTTSKTQGSLLSPSLKVCPLLARTPSGGVNVAPSILLGGCGGQNITGTTQPVVVGQQINLCASYGSISATSQSWTVPGTTVGGFNTGPTNGGPTTPTFNQQSTIFYWTVASSSAQTVTFTLYYGSGQKATAQPQFNISAPTSPSVSVPALGQWEIFTGSGQDFFDVVGRST